ncbi:MAG: histidine kinase dimerization/phospho-acceptor domain-containing protein [Candidatus Anammoxibacter sp.]
MRIGKEKENIECEEINTTGEVVSTLDHEINNPLTTVLGNVELLLLDDSLDMTIRSKLAKIRVSSLRIRDVVRKFTKNNCLVPVKHNSQVNMAKGGGI